MKCIKCGEAKEAEFCPSSLRRSDYVCKTCRNEITELWKTENPERWRKYQRKYSRMYMRNHPEVNRRNFRKWYKNNADKQYERRVAYIRADPQRHRAQWQALMAYPEAQVCEIDGCDTLGERHHGDYSRPYEIRWLCKKHHKELHRKYKTEVGTLA